MTPNNAHNENGSPATLCAEDPELFFPDEDLIYNTTKEAREMDPSVRAAEKETLKIAKALCLSCPYTIQCLELSFLAQKSDPHGLPPQGVWGGMSRRERMGLSKRLKNPNPIVGSVA